MHKKYTWRTGLQEALGGILALSVLFPAYLLAINAVRPRVTRGVGSRRRASPPGATSPSRGRKGGSLPRRSTVSS